MCPPHVLAKYDPNQTWQTPSKSPIPGKQAILLLIPLQLRPSSNFINPHLQGFPESWDVMRGPPVIILFSRIFHEINHPFWGMAMETPFLNIPSSRWGYSIYDTMCCLLLAAPPPPIITKKTDPRYQGCSPNAFEKLEDQAIKKQK